MSKYKFELRSPEATAFHVNNEELTTEWLRKHFNSSVDIREIDDNIIAVDYDEDDTIIKITVYTDKELSGDDLKEFQPFEVCSLDKLEKDIPLWKLSLEFYDELQVFIDSLYD